MSGLYIAPGTSADAKNAAHALSFTDSTERITTVVGDLAVAVTRVDNVQLWGPASDAASQVHVALGGRVSFDPEEWSRAESLPYQGGLAGRLLLEAWLKNPRELPARINGAGCVVIVDLRDRTLHVFTDRLGVFPIYQAIGRSFALCSHPDVLADFIRRSGGACDLDMLTLAEFIATGSAVQPFTYYRQIHQLEPATHYSWRLDTEPVPTERAVYWQPHYLHGEPSRDPEEIANALADAIRKAVLRRTSPRFGKPLVLLSGGADSRCAVFGAHDPRQVDCLTLFDEPNEELDTARRLAAAAGAKHSPVQRDPDYYAANAAESIRISGGMWSLVDAHYTGAASQIREVEPGVILTGCYADYMFKGLLLNRRYRTLFGRDLPLFDFADFDFQFYQEHAPLHSPWQQEVRGRLENRFPKALRDDYPNHRLAVEDLRLRPLSREPDSEGRLFLWRALPWDHLLSDNDVLDVYGRMSAEMKLNGIVFGKAVAKVCGPAAKNIFNNNYATPVDASETERAFWFLIAVFKRKLRKVTQKESSGPKLATPGSWPNWSFYVSHSKAIRTLWSNPASSERDLFTEICGSDPWERSLEQWSSNPLLLMRLLTARIWIGQRGLIAEAELF